MNKNNKLFSKKYGDILTTSIKASQWGYHEEFENLSGVINYEKMNSAHFYTDLIPIPKEMVKEFEITWEEIKPYMLDDEEIRPWNLLVKEILESRKIEKRKILMTE